MRPGISGPSLAETRAKGVELAKHLLLEPGHLICPPHLQETTASMLPVSLSAVAWLCRSLKAVLDFIVQFASHTGSDFFQTDVIFSKLFMSFLFLFMCMYTWHTYGGWGNVARAGSAMCGQPLLSVFLFFWSCKIVAPSDMLVFSL